MARRSILAQNFTYKNTHMHTYYKYSTYNFIYKNAYNIHKIYNEYVFKGPPRWH